MKKVVIISFMLTSWVLFSQTEENPDRILTYGLPMFYHSKAMELVGKKWGIEIYPVAGCLVSSELKDSVSKVNSKVWRKMDSIYGNQSEMKFRKETLIEMKKIKESYNIFEEDRQVKKLTRQIDRTKKYSKIDIDSVSNDGAFYYWTVYSYEINNFPDIKLKPEFKVRVDLKEQKAEIIELE